MLCSCTMCDYTSLLECKLIPIQDRLILSMEQEILRAQQRATKGHTPISACSVLLEKLLPPPELPVTGLKLDSEFRYDPSL